MSKTILIATDYSLESLNILKRVLQEKNALQDNTNIIYCLFPDTKWAIL
jgi:hypothetical protein